MNPQPEICGRCQRPFIGRDRGLVVQGQRICLYCRADLARQKPASPRPPTDTAKPALPSKEPATLEDETCERCFKVISRRARANIFNDQILCTPCLKFVTGASNPLRPATARQLDFLRSLGFADVDAFTFDQAHDALDRAQEVRYFAFQVARQEWGKDLLGLDLRPLVQLTFQHPASLEEIYQTMKRVDEAKFTRQHEYQELHYKDRDYQCPSLADCAPDLEKDQNYRTVRACLLALLGTSP